MKPNDNVVDDAGFSQQTNILKCARDTELGRLVRPNTRERAGAQLDVTIGRCDDSCDHVDDGALAGAIGPDESGDTPALKGDGELADSLDPAKTLGQLFKPKEVHKVLPAVVA